MPTFRFTDRYSNFTCLWEWSPTHDRDHDFRIIDLLIREVPESSAQAGMVTDRPPYCSSQDPRGVLKHLASKSRSMKKPSPDDNTICKLVVVTRPGFIIRNDTLQYRTLAWPFGTENTDFGSPGEYFDGIASSQRRDDGGPLDLVGEDTVEVVASTQADVDFLKILKNVFGAVVFCPDLMGGRDIDEAYKQDVDMEIANRLCSPLTMAHPLVNNRLVVAAKHCTGEVVDILATAYALGIRITLLYHLEECPLPEEDRAGLENYIYIPEPQDESISERIVTILASQGPFQGIVNFVNAWAAMTAKIARELGLRSMSPNVVHRLLDKHTIRQFCRAPSDTVRIDTQGQDLEDLVRLERHLETPGLLPEYPLIARPCFFGMNVLNRLATTSRELTRAIGACCMGFGPGTGLFIDYYEGGPEVEVYLALQDGEVLFSNIVDSFPTSADQCLPKDQKDEYFNLPEGHFLKTNLMWPSQLPQKEQDLARDTMYRILLEIGARDGVFQTRARIRNSSVHYADSGGLVDLVPRATPPEEEPSVLALEVLPQPSGDLAVYRGERVAYGVDYYALHMLCALGERERFRALARPYGFAGGAAPIWVDYVFTNVGAGLGYPDLTEGLGDVVRRERPDLREQVGFMKYWKSAKDNMWEHKTGIFVVISRVSRRRALEVAAEIKGMDKIETFMFFPRPEFSSL